jgi:hypothetical protein
MAKSGRTITGDGHENSAVRRRKICTGHVSGGRIKSERSRKGLANHIAISTATGVVNIFRLSNRWRTIDEIEAERLAALARELKPHRTFERRGPKLVKPPTPPKLMVIERPRIMRRVPSLPTMPWQDDGR